MSPEGAHLWNHLFPQKKEVSWETFALSLETHFTSQHSSLRPPSSSSSPSTAASVAASSSSHPYNNSDHSSGYNNHDNNNNNNNINNNNEHYSSSLLPPLPVKTLLTGCRLFLADGMDVKKRQMVTREAFEEFLELFGPLRLCLKKVFSNLFTPNEPHVVYPWYHGAISRKVAENLLLSSSSGPNCGKFLVRLSESQKGKFTIVYVNNNGVLKNVLVYNYFENGYGLAPSLNECADEHRFDNLPDFIAKHDRKLQIAVASAVHKDCPLQSSITMSSARSGPGIRPPNSPVESSNDSHKFETPFLSVNEQESPYGNFPSGGFPSDSATVKGTGLMQSSPLPTAVFDAEIENENYGCFGSPHAASRSSSSPFSRSSSSAEISRRQLSSKIDDAKHLCKELRYAEALELACSVVENLLSRAGRHTDGTDGADNEDLILLGKAYFQKGLILELQGASERNVLKSYNDGLAYLNELKHRCQTSDHSRFAEYQLLAKLNRKTADLCVRQGNVAKAEKLYAECSGLLLQDPAYDAELRLELVRHVKKRIPTLQDATASSLLQKGIEEYQQGSQCYSSASASLHRAVVVSRLCGAENIERRALANSATVDSCLGNNIQAIDHYHQCCILCRLQNDTTTLKQVMFKEALLLIKVGLCNRAVDCINVSISLASSLSNIQKLEDLKEKALRKLADSS